MQKPIVSIITVCLNSEKNIVQTIESVLNQTYKNIEYIIIDGGSTDKTLEYIREYHPKFNGRMNWITEKDEGLYFAMNKGIKMASGNILGIINSDDWYEKNAIECVVNEYINNPDIEFFYGNLNWINEEKNTNNLSVPMKDLNNYTYRYWMPFAHPTAFVCKKVYEKLGVFDTKYKIASDYDFILRCMDNGIKFKYINATLSNFREGGVSSNQYRTFKESTKIKIAHGYKPVAVWIRYYEIAIKMFIVNICEKNAVYAKLYTFYKKIRNKNILE